MSKEAEGDGPADTLYYARSGGLPEAYVPRKGLTTYHSSRTSALERREPVALNSVGLSSGGQ